MLLKKLRTIAAKTESVIGTAETLAATDGSFNAYDIEIQPQIEMDKRESQGSFGNRTATAGARGGTMTFKTDLEWDGTPTLPEWATKLLPACGYVEDTLVFTPRTEAPGANVKTLTMGVYIDGLFKSIAGAVGTFKIVMPTGKIAYIEWEFKGIWIAPSDVEMIAPAYPTAPAIRFADASVQYDGSSQCVSLATFDAANEIVMRECPGEVAGYESALVTNRMPALSMDPEAKLVADADPYGDWIAGTEAVFAATLKGPTTSTVTLSGPKAQIVNSQEADRNGLVTDAIDLQFNRNGSDVDEDVSITFAPAA